MVFVFPSVEVSIQLKHLTSKKGHLGTINIHYINRLQKSNKFDKIVIIGLYIRVLIISLTLLLIRSHITSQGITSCNIGFQLERKSFLKYARNIQIIHKTADYEDISDNQKQANHGMSFIETNLLPLKAVAHGPIICIYR